MLLLCQVTECLSEWEIFLKYYDIGGYQCKEFHVSSKSSRKFFKFFIAKPGKRLYTWKAMNTIACSSPSRPPAINYHITVGAELGRFAQLHLQRETVRKAQWKDKTSWHTPRENCLTNKDTIDFFYKLTPGNQSYSNIDNNNV